MVLYEKKTSKIEELKGSTVEIERTEFQGEEEEKSSKG